MFHHKRDTSPLSPFFFHSRLFWKTLGNFAIFRGRDSHGQLVSMHQAGTHYLKHIIACAIADKYEIPDPEFNHANDIFGGPKDEVVYQDIPDLLAATVIRIRYSFRNLFTNYLIYHLMCF